MQLMCVCVRGKQYGLMCTVYILHLKVIQYDWIFAKDISYGNMGEVVKKRVYNHNNML